MLPAGRHSITPRGLVRLAQRGGGGQSIGRDGNAQGGLPAGLLVPGKKISITVLLVSVLWGGSAVKVPLHRVVEMLEDITKGDSVTHSL